MSEASPPKGDNEEKGDTEGKEEGATQGEVEGATEGEVEGETQGEEKDTERDEMLGEEGEEGGEGKSGEEYTGVDGGSEIGEDEEGMEMAGEGQYDESLKSEELRSEAEEEHLQKGEETEIDEEEEEIAGTPSRKSKPAAKGKKSEKKALKGKSKSKKKQTVAIDDSDEVIPEYTDFSEEEALYMEGSEDELEDENKGFLEMEEEEEDDYEDEEDEYGYISGPFLSETCTVPENVLMFFHSFGYDCKRHYNICVPDSNTIIFCSGNYINFFDVKTGVLTFQRSARGGGLGHIVKNPKYPHVAVAEKGLNPLIIIYLWPSMERHRVLRGGAHRSYMCLNYSPNGKFLCSQGGEPDHFLTVWNWRRGKILRQQKAYGQDVYNAMFSEFNPGNLTTSGYGHIKFWKLARTFTGLKLMGSIGRFGKTEMCDIIGFVQMPDEQVISGCEWGNMLIWNEGLVKAEVCRKSGAPCHEGYISQIIYDRVNDELITVGTDGFIRAWDYKLIENADLVGDQPKIKIENLYALEVKNEDEKSEMLYIEKQDPNPDSSFWFGQDGNGGIWSIDMDQDHPLAPKKIFRSHAGGVRSIATCPYDTYVASYGDDGRVIFYNYANKETVLVHKFAAGGGFMLWPNLSVESSGDVVILGGADGVVRVAVVSLQHREAAGPSVDDKEFICLIQTTKPHTMRITYMSIYPYGKILVTGSEDATIFVYQILDRAEYISLNPIGFVKVPSEVTHLTWQPRAVNPTVVVSCFGGQVSIMEVPEVPQVYTKVSYELTHVDPKVLTFISVKSQIRRDILIDADMKRRQEKLEIKKQKLKKMKEENHNLKIDEELYLEDSESELSLESLYFPEVPSPVLFSMFIPGARNLLWLSAGGYDAGYIYEYSPDIDHPVRCTIIPDADDIEIHCYIFDNTRQYLFLGMQQGQIRVTRVNTSEFTDFSDYWMLSVHDNDNGIIPQMCFSYDEKFFFSCGRDGNVFAFKVSPYLYSSKYTPHKTYAPWPSDVLKDIDDPNMYSLEQLKQKAEYDRKMKLANDHKEEVLAHLKNIKDKLAMLIKQNKGLPLKLRIPSGEFKIDPKIEDDLDKELDEKLQLERRKVAYDAAKSDIALHKLQDYFFTVLDSPLVMVYGIENPGIRAYTFRNRALTEQFFDTKKFVRHKLEEAEKAQKQPPKRVSKYHPSNIMSKPLQLGTWLKGIGSIGPNIKITTKLQRNLLKYYDRKRHTELREEQWNVMMQLKPDPDVSHPDDVAAIEHAEKTIGDYKMKTDPNYTISNVERMTTDRKYSQLLKTRQNIYQLQKDYNDRIYKLRDRKAALINRIEDLHEQLRKIQRELPESERKEPPPIPQTDKETEYPEKEVSLQEELLRAHLKSMSTAQSVSKGSEDDEADTGQESAEDEEEEGGSEEEEELLFRDSLSSASEVFVTANLQRLDSDYELLLRDHDAPPPQPTRRSISGLRRKGVKSPFFPANSSSAHVRERFLSDVDIRRFIFRARHDDRDTPWEREMRYKRLCRSRYTQERLINDMEAEIAAFDQDLKETRDDRLALAVEVKFGELHLIKLHQELLVLKEFESVEVSLAQKVMDSEEELEGVRNEITEMDLAIDDHKKNIETISTQIKELNTSFAEKIEDSNYNDFLKRIYKKKYKPPKQKKSEDDSSESSESSSDSETSSDEDEGSMDSQDLGIMKLDESICPPDLDRAIYDMTFQMRTQRYNLEIKDMDERKEIEVIRKTKEAKFKTIKILAKKLEAQKTELLEFQREKQHRLNDVECVVALKASQLEYFDDPEADLLHMEDKLVFSRGILESLVRRVDELHQETTQQREKLRRYKQHHFRMHVDCKHMRKVIDELNQEIKTALQKKFGCEVNVEELEDIALQRLVLDLKSTLQDIKDEFERVTAVLKGEIRKKIKVLTCMYRSNGEKMNVLTLLAQEKMNLMKMKAPDDINQDELAIRHILEYSEELKKLRRVIKNQAQQINRLKEEIRTLGFKGLKPVPPVCTPGQLKAELQNLERLAAEADKLPDIPDEEEDDEDMFLYMESSEAVQMVEARSSLDDASSLPTARQIIDDLLLRVCISPDSSVHSLLNSEIQRLVGKIPATDTAFGIFDEVFELLSARVASNVDPPMLKEIFSGILLDMESMPTEPQDVRGIFEFVFKRVGDLEESVEYALEARAITYDILRKCIGFVLGQKFFLCTEEAMLQVMSTLEVDAETKVLLEEIMFSLNARLEEGDDRREIRDVLEDIAHDIRSLQDAEHPKDIFKMIFDGFRARVGPERDLAVARHIFHDILKKAISTVAETSVPLSEMEKLNPDQTIPKLLERLPRDTPVMELFDEVEVLLEVREPTVDPPETQHLVQLYVHEVENRPDFKTDDTPKFFEEIHKKFQDFGASKRDVYQTYSVICDSLIRAITSIFPEVEIEDVVDMVETGSVILALLDKIHPNADTTPLFEDIIEELTEKNQTELFSEGIQTLLPEIIRILQECQPKDTGIKKTFADVIDNVKSRNMFKTDIVCMLKLLEDAIRHGISTHHPYISLEYDKDVKNAELYIRKFLKYLNAKVCVPFFNELTKYLDAWQPKSSDLPDIEVILKEVVDKLKSLPSQSTRMKKIMSYIFNLIRARSDTKEIDLRLLYILKFCVKSAIRTVRPNIDLEDEECHFNPDDSTLEMLKKVHDFTYVPQMCSKIKEEITRLLGLERISKGNKKVLKFVNDKLPYARGSIKELTEITEIYPSFENILQELKKIDASRRDKMYARMHINDIVRKALTIVYPRINKKDAKCAMDKERSTLLILQKIPQTDDVLVLFEEIREEMETRFETIESDPEVHRAIHDVIVQLLTEPTDVDEAMSIINNIYMKLRMADMSRLSLLTAKNIFYNAVRKCADAVFPDVDFDDDMLIDKEWPTIQMLGQVPSEEDNVPVMQEVVDQISKEAEDTEGIVKDMFKNFLTDLAAYPLSSGNVPLFRPCFLKIKDWGAPVKYFKPFKEKVYKAVKRAIQKVYPDIELQDNQSAWEHEEDILDAALRLPATDDSSLLIDEIRERLAVIRDSMELSEELTRLFNEVDHHLTVLPLEPGRFEYQLNTIFTILRARKGNKNDIATLRTMVYKATRGALKKVHDDLTKPPDPPSRPSSRPDSGVAASRTHSGHHRK